MLKLFLVVLLAAVTQAAVAKTDTTYLYFNKDWKETTKKHAVYCGKVTWKGKVWYRQDFSVKDNMLLMDGYFSDDATKVMNGPARYYTATGVLDDSINYTDNRETSCYWYYPDGMEKAYIVLDEKGEITDQKGFDESGAEIPGYIVQKKPEYPDGPDAWQKFISHAILTHMPLDYREGRIWGSVTYIFTISPTGSVTDVLLQKSSGYYDLDNLAERIIEASADWLPAIQFNKGVAYKEKQEIFFPKILPNLNGRFDSQKPVF